MRIGIANDSPMAAEALSRVLASTPQHQIIWIARTGVEAVERCAKDRPDLILMDLFMPELNGVEATRRIMAVTPCAILIVTATVDSRSKQVFEALGAGALDAVSTPILGSEGFAGGAATFLAKLHALSWLIGRNDRRFPMPVTAAKENGRHPLIAIGASAGGPAALATILSDLPKDFHASIVIVQHVDEGFAGSLATWLNEQSAIPVKVATEGVVPPPGVALIAGTSNHLVFKSAQTLGYTPDPISHSYRPSVDVFFQSILSHWLGEVTALVLTGMGRDGAKGLKGLRDAGFHTIAQDRDTCVVYGMPKAAVEMQAAVEVLPLTSISQCLRKRHC